LSPIEIQYMTILTFGSEQRNKMCDVVEIGVETRSGLNQLFKLFSVPFICKPLLYQCTHLAVEKFDNLHPELADSSDGTNPMEVDTLIVSDHYWDLVTGETVRSIDGPVAINTRMGWVLSGSLPSSHPQPEGVSLLTTHTLRVDSVCGTERAIPCTPSGSWSH